MRPSAWPGCHPPHRHAERPPMDGNHHRRYRKDHERTLDDKGNPTGQRIRRNGPTSGERVKHEETGRPPAPVDADHGRHPPVDDNPMTPDYYKTGGVETIDYLHAFLTEDEFNGFCKGNIIKYVSRANRKNGLEDIRKARDYIRYLITGMKGEWKQ